MTSQSRLSSIYKGFADENLVIYFIRFRLIILKRHHHLIGVYIYELKMIYYKLHHSIGVYIRVENDLL